MRDEDGTASGHGDGASARGRAREDAGEDLRERPRGSRSNGNKRLLKAWERARHMAHARGPHASRKIFPRGMG